MGISTDFKKHFLMPAFVGAALTYGVHCLIDDDAARLAEIRSLESRILDLEVLLSQKEEELADARFFATGAFASAQQQNQTNQPQTGDTKKQLAAAEQTSPAQSGASRRAR